MKFARLCYHNEKQSQKIKKYAKSLARTGIPDPRQGIMRYQNSKRTPAKCNSQRLSVT